MADNCSIWILSDVFLLSVDSACFPSWFLFTCLPGYHYPVLHAEFQKLLAGLISPGSIFIHFCQAQSNINHSHHLNIRPKHEIPAPQKNPGDMKQGSKHTWGVFYIRITLTWEYLSSGLHLKWGVVHEYPHIWRALQFDVNSGLERFPKLILVEQLPFHWHKPLEKTGHWLLTLLLWVFSLSLKKMV